MKKTFRKALTVVLTIIMTALCFMTYGCNDVEEYDETKTQLFVANYAGGVGVAGIQEAANRFEEKYKDYEGENGKVGVQVIIDNQKEYEGQQIAATIRSSSQEIYFTGNAQYFEFAFGGYVKDVTDLVKRVGEDGKTIESKLWDEHKAALNIDGKYYGLPHYEIDDGLSYDATVFEDNKLYFADEIDESDTTYPGTRKFIINKTTKKSCGPNGVYGDYDDGLPSSYAEFYKLFDKMKGKVNGFVWAGQLTHYTLILAVGLSNNYLGADGLRACFTFDSNEKPIEIITGFDAGGSPIIENIVITENNAYLLKQAAANYYALEFCSKIYQNGSGLYDTACTAGTVSNLGAMELFANSGMAGGKRDAMMIEGSYWYNEACSDGIFKRLQEDYPETYNTKQIKYMPLPFKYSGTVTEGNGRAPVFSGAGASYCFINANIDAGKVDLAEKFVAFCYTDDELVKFTENSNGITKCVKYDYKAANVQNNIYAQSLVDYKAAASDGGQYVVPFSNNRIFKSNTKFFGRNNTSGYWDSTVNNQKYAYIYVATRQGISAKDYFKGMWMTESEWKNYKG